MAHDVWYQLGFNENDFHLMTLMSSWATCGVRVGGTTGEPKGSGVLWSASTGVYCTGMYVCMYVCTVCIRTYVRVYVLCVCVCVCVSSMYVQWRGKRSATVARD